MATLTSHKKGFVLAFSLLLSSIVLALAFGIFNILLKQIVLTSSAKDSQIAFYAADAGAECALYWDTHTSRDPSFFPDQQFPYNYTGMFALSVDNPDVVSFGYPDSNQVGTELASEESFSCGTGIMHDILVEDSSDLDQVPGFVTLSNFSFDITGDRKVCARVRVSKRYNSSVISENPKSGFDTIIESRGYNNCDSESIKRVERAIEVKY